MNKRRWITGKLFVLSILGAIGLFVGAQLCFSPCAVAQETENSPFENITNFLIEQGNNFSAYPETLQEYSFDSGNIKEIDLGFLGKIVLRADSAVNIPATLDFVNNRYSAQASVSLRHELEDVRMPTLVKIDLRGDILDREKELARLTITFDGLLLKGLPLYLSGKGGDTLKEYGIELIPDNKKDSKATLCKVITMTSEQQRFFKQMQDIDLTLRDTQQALQKKQLELEAAIRDQTEKIETVRAEVKKFQNDLKDVASQKSKILVQLLGNIPLPCAPEFKREFRFPIYESGGRSRGGRASAEARLGIWGDVVINIQPTCGLSVKSLFQYESWIDANIDITSSGHLGGHADVQARVDTQSANSLISVEFNGYPVPITISDEEQQAFEDIVVKILDKAQDTAQILQDFQQQINDQASQMYKNIYETFTEIKDSKRMCDLLSDMGAITSGSEAEGICKILASVAPPKPPVDELPEFPDLPGPVEIADRILNSNELNKFCSALGKAKIAGIDKENICNVFKIALKPETLLDQACTSEIKCPTLKDVFGRNIVPEVKMCATPTLGTPKCRDKCFDGFNVGKGKWERWCVSDCEPTKSSVNVPCGFTFTDQPLNLFCENINTGYKSACGTIRDVKNAFDAEYKRVEEIRHQMTEDANREIERWEEQLKQWNQTLEQNQKNLPRVFANAVKKYALVPKIDARTIAQELLNFAWRAQELGEEAQEGLELTKYFMKWLSSGIDIKGSARVSLDATAHLVHVKPRLKTGLAFDLDQNGQPAFKIDVSGVANTRTDQESGLVGLDALNYTLAAGLNGSVFENKFALPELKIGGKILPTVPMGKIPLSDAEIPLFPPLSYKYNRTDTPPQSGDCGEQGTQAGVMLWNRFKSSDEVAAFCEHPSDIPPMLQEQLHANATSACGTAFNQALTEYVKQQIPQMIETCQRPITTVASKLTPPELPAHPPIDPPSSVDQTSSPDEANRPYQAVYRLEDTPTKSGFRGLYTLFSPDTAQKGRFGFGIYWDATRFCLPGDPRYAILQELSIMGYYGVTDRLEIGASAPLRQLDILAASAENRDPRDPALQDISESGMGNVSLGIRYNLIKNVRFAMTPYVQAFLPIDQYPEKGFGAENTRIHFGVSAGTVLTGWDNTRLYTQVAYQYATDYDQDRKDFTELSVERKPRFDYFGTNPLYHEYGNTLFYGAGLTIPVVQDNAEVFGEFQFYHSFENKSYIPMYEDGKELDVVQDGGMANAGVKFEVRNGVALTAGWSGILFAEEPMYESPHWKVFIGLTYKGKPKESGSNTTPE